MATFRKYGGLNYSANNNITSSFISNANKTNINTVSGQPNSKEVFASHIDLSGNSILHTGTIYFMDGTSQNTAGIQNPESNSDELSTSNIRCTTLWSTNLSDHEWVYENISASTMFNWNAFNWYFYTNNPTTFEKSVSNTLQIDTFEVPSSSSSFVLSSGTAIRREVQITCDGVESTDDIWTFIAHVNNNQGLHIETSSTINSLNICSPNFDGWEGSNLTFSLTDPSQPISTSSIGILKCTQLA